MKYLFLFLLCVFSSKSIAQPGALDPDFSNGGIATIGISSDAFAVAMAVQPDGKLLLAGSAQYGVKNHFALMRVLPDGSPDASFGTNGIVLTTFGNASSYGRAIALQPDGKIVVAGYSYGLSNFNVALARYFPDGTPDAAFGNGGKVNIDAGSEYEIIYGLAIQPDGKIIAVGVVTQPGSGNEDFAIVRCNSDGSLDPSFGSNGIALTDINSNDRALDVVVQPDGKIVVAGSNGDFVALRYNSDGTPDSTFSGDGKVTTSVFLSSSVDGASSIALQPDGKILLGGSGIVFPSPYNEFALVRYNPDGTPDFSFAGAGKTTTSIGPEDDYCNSIALQPDGKIVMAGISFVNGNWDFSLARFTSDGLLDDTFSDNGKISLPANAGNDACNAVEVGADGKIWAGGYADGVFGNEFALLKLDTAGVPDADFNQDGIATFQVGKSASQGNAVALQADGRLLIAGSGTLAYEAQFVRFLEDGTPDLSFGTDGKMVDGSVGSAYAVLQQPDGKILAVAGINGDHYALARYLPNGARDSSFGQNGKVISDFGNGSEYVDEAHALALQTDGKIIVAGNSFHNNGGGQSYFALARYNPDGLPDNTFGGDGKVTTPIGTDDYYASCNSVAIQADGKIVAGGYSYYTNSMLTLHSFDSFPTARPTILLAAMARSIAI